MSTQVALYRTSIAKKFFMGLTGLGLSLFVLSHMIGNLLILVSPEAYNRYGHALISNPAIYLAEAGLVFLFLYHSVAGIKLAIQNRKARPGRYAVSASGPKAASLSSKSMAYSGSLILVFLILHIATFKYGTHYSATYNGVEMRDLHRLVVEVFQSPGYIAWYLLCLVLLGVHLSHGFASTFQSMGLYHVRYQPLIKKAGWAYAILVTAGFIVQPLYVYFLLKQ